MARVECWKDLKMADMDELEWNGCSNNDLRQHVQHWSQCSPIPAPSFLFHGLMLHFHVCCKNLGKYIQPTAVSGDVYTADYSTEVSGYAEKELIWVPLAMWLQPENLLVNWFLSLLFNNSDNRINTITESRCLRAGSCWFTHSTHLPPKLLQSEQAQQVRWRDKQAELRETNRWCELC